MTRFDTLTTKESYENKKKAASTARKAKEAPAHPRAVSQSAPTVVVAAATKKTKIEKEEVKA